MAEKKKLTLHEKISKIQVGLKAPKNLFNKFGGYKYRNLEGIFEGLKPWLDKYALRVHCTDEIREINGLNYLVAVVSISDGKDEVTMQGWAREPVAKKGMDDAQITGATSSYARKYAMNGLFAIDDVKDADSMDNSDHVTPEVPPHRRNGANESKRPVIGG